MTNSGNHIIEKAVLMNRLDDGELNRFLRAYDPLQVIFEEGEPGNCMCIVQDGLVDIRKNVDTGSIFLLSLGRGEFFGEMALVNQSPRSASAVAGPDGAKVLFVDSAHFVYLVSQQPAFALIVLSVMARRLRAMNEKKGNTV